MENCILITCRKKQTQPPVLDNAWFRSVYCKFHIPPYIDNRLLAWYRTRVCFVWYRQGWCYLSDSLPRPPLSLNFSRFQLPARFIPAINLTFNALWIASNDLVTVMISSLDRPFLIRSFIRNYFLRTSICIINVILCLVVARKLMDYFKIKLAGYNRLSKLI